MAAAEGLTRDMAMTTVDARLTYDYALRDAALERIRRLERVGWVVKLRYVGENRYAEVWKTGRRNTLEIALSRYTDVALMESAYTWLIEHLDFIVADAADEWLEQMQAALDAL